MQQQRVAIVGAGIVGLSTAYALLKQGVEHVTILEQATVDHPKSTSRGLSRLLRFEYGPDLLYTQMVQASLNRWQSLERISQRTLYTPTELLVLGKADDAFTEPSYHLLRALGLPTTLLSQKQCEHAFPQFASYTYDTITYNTKAAILYASQCLHILKEQVLSMGGIVQEVQRVTHMIHENPRTPIRLHLASGDEYMAERVVLATGPWVHRLLGNLALPVSLTRQYVLYFANMPAADSFSLHNFPAFSEHELYGFPIHSTYEGRGPHWLKVASHSFGAPIDPDTPSTIDEGIIHHTLKKIYELLPATRYADLAHIDSCIYDVSPDENFILDYLPSDQRIVFATGLSGHGFKFGPVLGELLSSLVQETRPLFPMERFQLTRFNKPRISAPVGKVHTMQSAYTSVA